MERHFHRYLFINLPDRPGGDPWGLLYFPDEEIRLGKDYIAEIRRDYDQTLKSLLADNSDSQFGNIVLQDYYQQGFFPRLRNETKEVMDAYGGISPEAKGSGKCAAFAFLWAAALIIWGRFLPDKVTIIGNRAHVFVFLDEEEGHLFNNTKWFSRTRINNCSELSEFVKMVTTSTDTTFFFNPIMGMCICQMKRSNYQKEHLVRIFSQISSFLSLPLRNPLPDSLQFTASSQAIPNPLESNSPLEYERTIFQLAERFPGSIFDFARYCYRSLSVPLPHAYIRAALRDYHAMTRGRKINALDEALAVVKGIAGGQSIFGDRRRIALPDETLLFQTGTDRDKALLLFTLLYHSPLRDLGMSICFTSEQSFVHHNGQWIDVETLSFTPNRPSDVKLEFDNCSVIGDPHK